MSVSKEWENTLDARKVGSIDMTVLMGDKEFHKVTLKDPEWTAENIYISPGIIKNGQVLPGAEGHDFTFAELGSEQYNWELVSPVVHPMLINGTLTMLTMVDKAHPAPAGAATYTIGGKTYYSNGSSAASLDAYNYRRSNLNLTKVVTGEEAPENATFPFTLTVNNSKASSGSASDTNSDYYVWFSIYDTKAGAPKGDLMRFPKGATVLDMAYYIHSKVGSACTGARINNKLVTFRQELRSGDQVEIMTSTTQRPKQEWLQIVKTSRAKSKIRLALKETQQKEALMVKEMLERRFRNRKIEQEEALMMRTIKKLGYKETSDFYRDIAQGTLDTQTVLDKYIEIQQGDRAVTGDNVARSAEEFVLEEHIAPVTPQNDDVLVIDQNLKGVDYMLARCCNPIYGDKVFGFVTSGGGIKIHRCDCPNAPEMHRRFGYRIVRAKWSGKGSSQYQITLRIIGNDDLGIINNLTSIISKDEKLVLRSINIDSDDGLFRGNLVVMLNDNSRLEGLIKKLRTVRGVKSVERI